MGQTTDSPLCRRSLSEAEVMAARRRVFEGPAQLRAEVIRGWGQGDDDVVAKQSRAQERVDHDVAREFRACLYDEGLAWIDGPPEYGGQGLSTAAAERFLELTLQYAIHPTGSLLTTLRIVAPAVAERSEENPSALQSQMR